MSRSAAAPSLKSLIGRGRIVVAPGAYDALSALLIEQAGFEAIYLTGNGQAASMLGLPDVGLVTLTEMAGRVRCTRAVTSLPLIADADVGYGSLLSVRRAMRELEAAGASAVQFEDQAAQRNAATSPAAASSVSPRWRSACARHRTDGVIPTR